MNDWWSWILKLKCVLFGHEERVLFSCVNMITGAAREQVGCSHCGEVLREEEGTVQLAPRPSRERQ